MKGFLSLLARGIAWGVLYRCVVIYLDLKLVPFLASTLIFQDVIKFPSPPNKGKQAHTRGCAGAEFFSNTRILRKTPSCCILLFQIGREWKWCLKYTLGVLFFLDVVFMSDNLYIIVLSRLLLHVCFFPHFHYLPPNQCSAFLKLWSCLKTTEFSRSKHVTGRTRWVQGTFESPKIALLGKSWQLELASLGKFGNGWKRSSDCQTLVKTRGVRSLEINEPIFSHKVYV